MPGQPSHRADQRILRIYGNGGQQEPIVPVVTAPVGRTVTARGTAAVASRVLDAAKVRSDVRVVDYASTRDAAFLTSDRRSAFALVFTPRNRKSNVISGLDRTGRLVTSAAIILAFAFFAMSTGPQTDIKILATGLGAGVLIDALFVRRLLVPASVALLGWWNSWLPRVLARPRLNEGFYAPARPPQPRPAAGRFYRRPLSHCCDIPRMATLR